MCVDHVSPIIWFLTAAIRATTAQTIPALQASTFFIPTDPGRWPGLRYRAPLALQQNRPCSPNFSPTSNRTRERWVPPASRHAFTTRWLCYHQTRVRMNTLFTIGFTHKSAEDFFTRLRKAGVKRVVDVRLNNVSQLAGFSKRDDLQYFLKTILGIDYIHLPVLAPTQDILDEFKKNKGDWKVYEDKFLRLIEARQIEKQVPREVLSEGCLLCSEDKPHHCHRRLVAEYLRDKLGDIRIGHL